MAVADLAEVVRLYGLRMWVEQSYKQVKHALGWSQYQVRGDRAMRGTGSWSAAPSPSAGSIRAIVSPARHQPSQRALTSGSPLFLLKLRERGKKISGHTPLRPQVCWSVARCSVRAWLEPWIMRHRAIGVDGQLCPHLLLCNCCFSGLNADTPSLSTALLDPRQQTTDISTQLSADLYIVMEFLLVVVVSLGVYTYVETPLRKRIRRLFA